MDEGYIKFNCTWIHKELEPLKEMTSINNWRERFYEKGLIGVYDNGIGFGNMSMRLTDSKILITGSATGVHSSLNENHFSIVTAYNLLDNSVVCEGAIKASSESLTHAALYDCDKKINAVIHIHHLGKWKSLLNKVPTTNIEVPYGTPEMAFEIQRLFRETTVASEKIIVMGGHKEGIISFGETIEEASSILLNYFK
jgi:ribulose-5-phosphate 4-epimerase/fuculose-1-phosphate aldolase